MIDLSRTRQFFLTGAVQINFLVTKEAKFYFLPDEIPIKTLYESLEKLKFYLKISF
jgi:hypothetical protein